LPHIREAHSELKKALVTGSFDSDQVRIENVITQLEEAEITIGDIHQKDIKIIREREKS